jgi:hypothetical protein
MRLVPSRWPMDRVKSRERHPDNYAVFYKDSTYSLRPVERGIQDESNSTVPNREVGSIRAVRDARETDASSVTGTSWRVSGTQ